MNIENLTTEQKEAIFYSVNFVYILHTLMKNLPSMALADSVSNLFMPDRLHENFVEKPVKVKEPEQIIPIKRRRTFAGECRVIQLSERRVAGEAGKW